MLPARAWSAVRGSTAGRPELLSPVPCEGCWLLLSATVRCCCCLRLLSLVVDFLRLKRVSGSRLLMPRRDWELLVDDGRERDAERYEGRPKRFDELRGSFVEFDLSRFFEEFSLWKMLRNDESRSARVAPVDSCTANGIIPQKVRATMTIAVQAMMG